MKHHNDWSKKLYKNKKLSYGFYLRVDFYLKMNKYLWISIYMKLQEVMFFPAMRPDEQKSVHQGFVDMEKTDKKS